MNGVPSGEKYLTKQTLFRKNFDSLKFEGYSFSMTLQKSKPVINNNKSLFKWQVLYFKTAVKTMVLCIHGNMDNCSICFSLTYVRNYFKPYKKL